MAWHTLNKKGENSRVRDLIKTVIGKHPPHADANQVGRNLRLLHGRKGKRQRPPPRRITRVENSSKRDSACLQPCGARNQELELQHHTCCATERTLERHSLLHATRNKFFRCRADVLSIPRTVVCNGAGSAGNAFKVVECSKHGVRAWRQRKTKLAQME